MQVVISNLLSFVLMCHCIIACQNANGSTFSADTVIRTEVNVSFVIKQEACLSCGYDWFMEAVDTSAIKLLDKSNEPINPDRKVIGGNAIVIWQFVALKTGNYQLVFYYKRPWEEEILKTERIKIIVAEQKASISDTISSTIIPPE